MHEIGYKVTKDNSTFTIGKKDLTVGLLGVVYADADTGAVLGLTNVATDIPAKYPLQAVTMDYQWEYMKLGEQVALVPLKADMHEKDGKTLVWNEVEFRDYKPEAMKKTSR